MLSRKKHPHRRGPTASVAAAALVLAACLGKGAGSASSGGYPGGGGPGAPPQRQGQPPSGGGYPPQQQQYRPGTGPAGQATPSSSQGAPQQQQQGPAGGRPGGPQGAAGPGSLYGRPGPMAGQPPQQQQGGMMGAGAGAGGDPRQAYRGVPPGREQQQGYGVGGQPPQGGPGGGHGGSGYGAAGYPGGQGGYGRPSYPPQGAAQQQQQQQQQQAAGDASGGLLSRLANKLKGGEGQQLGGPPQGYGGRYGGGSQYPPQGPPPQGWQPPSRPGMALQATGPSRGPIQSGYQGQDGGYGQQQQPQQQLPHQQHQHQQYQPQQHQQHQQQQGPAGADGVGIWSRFKGKVFQGDTQDADDGPPSFRPQGSALKAKEAPVANGNAQNFGGTGAFGNPYPSFGGPPGMGMGGGGGVTPEPSGPGVAEVISVENSIVMVLKPNELAKKKRKFKQDGANRLQVITTFDHCLTGFHTKDGKTSCLKTTDVLEQNQHVMLPEAAKKVRYLRSDFKRRMEADGKAMSPEERVAALEDNLRKVYSVVAMEGGVHMNSIGPAIESQLDSIPLRDGVDDMTAALAWRAIPMTIFCAGYGNVAMEVLRRGSPKITGPGGVFTPHLRLVANFFKPDDTMTIIGMYDTVPLIHEAKKSGATLLEFLRGVRQEHAFASRSNVLLLGAELSDLGLTNGLPSVEERISVGFLKLDEHVLDKLPRYAQAYDVVIIGDGDMSYANEILHEVVG